MAQPDLIIRGRKVVVSDSTGPTSIHIRDGKIMAIAPFDDVAAGCPLVEADEMIVMPGLVDTHVHINEPGRTGWEGFRTATRAAAAGGVTTLVEMPLNSIPATTTLRHLETKRAAAEGKCHVDVGFWGGVVPGNVRELPRMFDRGVFGFKCFLVPSGVDEFPHVTEADLREALPEIARLGALLIVHAESPDVIEAALAGGAHAEEADPRRYGTFLRSRPAAAEDLAVALMIRLSRETGARVHIVHHSSMSSLPCLRAARDEGLPITVETCPHYLAFAAEEIAEGATTFKCCPPIRERENLEALWAALDEGVIDMIVSDHSPCPPEMKLTEAGDFMRAWGGISSLQLRLPVVWTEMRARGHTIERLAEWTAAAPARLVGLDGRKGALRVGSDADILIFRPDAPQRVEPALLEHRHKLTPYAGLDLRGVVEATYLRGMKIYERGEFIKEAAGMLLSRE